MTRKLFALFSMIIILSMVLSACQAQKIVETVVVTVEKQVQGQTVVQTQIVEVTPTPAPTEAGTPVPVIKPEFKNPDTFAVITGAGEPESLDPAWTYETAGSATEANIYEGLVFYNRDKYDSFIPALATEWTTSPDGLTWTFKIRTGVTFHEGGTLEPHDVAYTNVRMMLQGRTDGPEWVLYEGFFGSDLAAASSKDFAAALLGKKTFEDLSPADLVKVCEDVKATVVADDTAGTVTFHLKQPMPWMLALEAGNFMGDIVDSEWMAKNGDWDGDCKTWQNFADPAAEKTILFNKANGTGPYKLDHWTPGEEIVLVANDKYWRTEPMWDGGPSGAPKIKRVLIKNIPEWGTRLAMLQAGDADYIYTPAQYRPQLYPYGKTMCDAAGKCTDANPTGYLQLYAKLPQPAMTPAQFNWQINVEGGNPYVGSGALDGNGIPPNFFSDLHVRKAFSYCFDYDTFIKDALNNEGIQAQGPIIQGMMGYRTGEKPLYSYDPAKCEEEFKASELKNADGKSLWDTGFYMQIAYNQGNDTRRLLGEILKSGIESVNPKFNVQVLAMPWPVLLASRRQAKLPIYIGGWLEDFHDPHNWVQPFLFSQGSYGRVINMTDDFKKKYDALIIQGVQTVDQAARQKIYEQIQLDSEQDAVVLWAYQVLEFVDLQTWIKGFYYNPAYFNNPYTWVYALEKVAP